MKIPINGPPNNFGQSRLRQSASRMRRRSRGYIDVGDGCWRPNVLVTSLRCW